MSSANHLTCVYCGAYSICTHASTPKMLGEIDTLQTNIMLFIKEWAATQNTPVPRKEIIKRMVSKGNNEYTTIHAISSLVIKGFIRRAYSEKQNQTLYVMIRNI